MADAPAYELEINDLRRRRDADGVLKYWRHERSKGLGKGLDIVVLWALILLGHTFGALTVLTASMLDYPDDFYLKALESEIRFREGDIYLAFQTAEAAGRLDPHHIMTIYRVGILAIRLKKFDVALRSFDEILVMFLTDEFFSLTSFLPLYCLLRIYSILGPASAQKVGEYLDGLRTRGHPAFIEITPFLERIAACNENKLGARFHLKVLASHHEARAIYVAQDIAATPLQGYDISLRDLSQHHLRLPNATISGSFGAVWTESECFALDHGFHSATLIEEFDVENKIIATHDEAISGFCLAERYAYINTDRNTQSIERDVLVIPPCHHSNFGHLVHDVLALKFGFDRIRLDAPNVVPILLRPFPSKIFKTAFELTFGRDYLVISDSKINYNVNSVHLLSLPHAMWREGGGICLGPARYLRNSLMAPSNDFPAQRRIFVSRRGIAVGSIDEACLLMCESFGFEPVFLEALTEADYFALIRGASHIAGMHGAGLMNFMFATAGVRVAEFRRPGGNWHSIAAFANASGVDFSTFDLSEPGLEAIRLLRDEFAVWLQRPSIGKQRSSVDDTLT